MRSQRKPLGLVNFKNTCYFNSVIQCLTYTPSLADFCINQKHSSRCYLIGGQCPFCILEKRILRSLSLDDETDDPFKGSSNCLRILPACFNYGDQEDAHEFLVHVINECNKTSLPTEGLSNGKNVVEEIFGGVLQSQVKCLSCGAESNKEEKIMDISLEISRSKSVEESMENFFETETLEGNNMYNCQNCEQLVTARKKMSVLQAPEILVIHLKRFESIFGGKIDKSITFDENLDLSSFINKPSMERKPKYKLFGIIVHEGVSSNSGHYYACVKDKLGQWYCCNDSFVSLSTLQEVLSKKAYILFFSCSSQKPASAKTPDKTGFVASMARISISDEMLARHNVEEEEDEEELEAVARSSNSNEKKLSKKSKSSFHTILKNSDGSKTKLINVHNLEDAKEAGGQRSSMCTLILTEGLSAKFLTVAGISVLGRDLYGVYPLAGKFINVRGDLNSRIVNNEEIKNLKKILGLKQDEVYKDVDGLRYGSILLMMDMDHDGSHIKGLIINFFHCFWPELLKLDPPFISDFVTPIVKATRKGMREREKKEFYSKNEYDDWISQLFDLPNWNIIYHKGLGSYAGLEMRYYFHSFRHQRKKFVWSEGDEVYLALAFDKTNVEARRSWLSKGTSPRDWMSCSITYKDFVEKDLIFYFIEKNIRSIPQLLDGLKPGQRKVMYCSLMRHSKGEGEMRVDEFCGFVSKQTSYHHGELSLANTIISMGQNYVGSNNLNLLEPIGHYGTRAFGGKDAAQARYIYTELSRVASFIFRVEDKFILEYKNDGCEQIEPISYMPIIPMVLVNGCKGIGSGWSSDIPRYNPRDIIMNIMHLFDGESMVPMKPWYQGFQGDIKEDKSKEGAYTCTGTYVEVDATTLRITELPVGNWINDYRQILDGMSAGKNFSIKSFNDFCSDQLVQFEIIMSEENMNVARTEGFEKIFKLTSIIHTNNMHLFYRGCIKKYDTPEQIIEDYFNLRLKFYEKRMMFRLEYLSDKLEKLKNKVVFIQKVVNGQISVVNRDKSGFVKELEDAGIKAHDDIVSMPIDMLTTETIDKLKGTITDMEQHHKLYSCESKELWRIELRSLLKVLDELDDERVEQHQIPPIRRQREAGVKRKHVE